MLVHASFRRLRTCTFCKHSVKNDLQGCSHRSLNLKFLSVSPQALEFQGWECYWILAGMTICTDVRDTVRIWYWVFSNKGWNSVVKDSLSTGKKPNKRGLNLRYAAKRPHSSQGRVLTSSSNERCPDWHVQFRLSMGKSQDRRDSWSSQVEGKHNILSSVAGSAFQKWPSQGLHLALARFRASLRLQACSHSYTSSRGYMFVFVCVCVRVSLFEPARITAFYATPMLLRVVQYDCGLLCAMFLLAWTKQIRQQVKLKCMQGRVLAVAGESVSSRRDLAGPLFPSLRQDDGSPSCSWRHSSCFGQRKA